MNFQVLSQFDSTWKHVHCAHIYIYMCIVYLDVVFACSTIETDKSGWEKERPPSMIKIRHRFLWTFWKLWLFVCVHWTLYTANYKLHTVECRLYTCYLVSFPFRLQSSYTPASTNNNTSNTSNTNAHRPFQMFQTLWHVLP